MGAIYDWLDVLNDLGPGRIAAVLGDRAAGEVFLPKQPEPKAEDAAPERAPSTEAESKKTLGDGEVFWPADVAGKARVYLDASWAAPLDDREVPMMAAHRLLAVVGGASPETYRYTPEGWVPIQMVQIEHLIGNWESEVKLRAWNAKDEEYKAVHLSNRAVAEVADRLIKEVLVEPPRTPHGPASSFWLARDYFSNGEPIWGRPSWERALTDAQARAEGLPPVARLLMTPGYVLDLEAWDKGRVKTLEHSPRLFCRSAVTAAPTPEQLRAAMDVVEEGAGSDRLTQLEILLPVIEGLAPEYVGVLKHAWGFGVHATMWREYMSEWAKLIGYLLADDREHEFGNIAALVGASGHGKGTAFLPVRALLGDLAASIDIGQMADDRFLVELRGKHLAYNEEARIGAKDDGDRALAVLLQLTGGGTRTTRRLFDRFADTKTPLAARFLLAFKQMPNFKGAEDLKRRMLLFEFRYPVPQTDESLKVRLQEQRTLQAVMLMGLIGRHWLREDGGFVNPSASATSLAVFYENTQLLDDDFFERCLKLDGDADSFVPNDDLADLVRGWLIGERGNQMRIDRKRALALLLPSAQARGWAGESGLQRTVARDGEERKWRPRGWTRVVLTAAGDAVLRAYRGEHERGAGYDRLDDLAWQAGGPPA